MHIFLPLLWIPAGIFIGGNLILFPDKKRRFPCHFCVYATRDNACKPLKKERKLHKQKTEVLFWK
jgi:hypothetical protein